MAGTPLLLITDAGLAAASIAMPEGPYIHITGFEIGSGFGYTPQPTDTGLNGNLLFSGVPSSYQNIGNNTLNIICEIPPDAGPFDFGEVALFLDGGVMFAKAVFDTPQTKFSSLGTNVVSSYTLNCLIKLQQSTAVFQIDTNNGPPAVFEIFQWSDVFPPGVSANPDIPLYLVRENNEYSDSTILQNTDDAHWTVGSNGYNQYETSTHLQTFPVANSSTTWVEVLATLCHPADLTTVNRRFLIETADGFFRSVLSVVVSGANYRFNLNTTNDGTYNNVPLLSPPPVASLIKIFRDDQAGGQIYYSQIVDPPAIAPATAGVPGLATAGQGLYIQSAGLIAAQGLLHSPGQNTGRFLTNSDDLNNLNLLSGMYAVLSGSFGFPANAPQAIDGEVWVQNYGPGNDITQMYYPTGAGGGTAGTGAGGAPIFWRSYKAGVWYPWYKVSVGGKGGSGGTINQQQVAAPAATITMNSSSNGGWAGGIIQPLTGFGIIQFTVPDNSARTTSLIRNGTIISQNSKSGSAGFGRYQHDWTAFNPGDTITYNTVAGQLTSVQQIFL